MCRGLLKVWNFEFCFVRRARNQVAHALARHSVFHTSPHVGEVPPTWVANQVSYMCFSTTH
ncbi:hypothetical protein LINGRAHAP2_LOCUS18042 [Linum grandiflorum]